MNEDTKNVVCPFCARELSVRGDMSETFCNYCGKKFSLSSAGNASLLPGESERIAQLWKDADYAAIAETTYDGVEESDAAIGIQRKVSEYFVLTRDYLAQCDELLANLKVTNGLAKMFLGKDELSDSPIHAVYYDKLEKLLSDICALFTKALGAGQEPLVRDAASRLVRALLAQKDPDRDTQKYWLTVAVEHFSIPLLPFLSDAELGDFSSQYGGFYERYNRLPNQQRVLDAMRAELQKRGLEIPKTLKKRRLFG